VRQTDREGGVEISGRHHVDGNSVKLSDFEGSQAVPTRPVGRGAFEGGKALGSEQGKGLGCGVYYEQRR
jgi:hypothetical protein